MIKLLLVNLSLIMLLF